MSELKPTTSAEFSLGQWRENFLRILLTGTSILGSVLLAINYLLQKAPAYLAAYTTIFIVLLAVTIFRLKYGLRAGVFVTLICLLGISSLIETGIWGGSRMFFLTFVIMTGLLFSPRAGINAIVISMGLVFVAGWLALTGQYRPTDLNVSAGNLGVWGINTSALLLVEAIVTIGIYQFQKQFMEAQARANQVVDALGTAHAGLEARVAERTQALEERNIQMRASVFFARQISDIQDVPTLLDESVKLITQQFKYYHAAVYLLDDQARYALLQSASSDEGKKLLERGHRVQVDEQSVVGRVAQQGRLYNFTGSLFAGVRDPEMPRTRSQVALPLLTRGKVIGVLDVHSEKLQAFGQNEAELFQSLADQIAVSIANARLLSESQAAVNQLAAITSRENRRAWQEHLKLRKIAYQFTPAGIKSIPSGIRSKDKNELSVPLILRGQEIGTIGLRRKDQAYWADADRELAEKIANQIALALENSRLLDETRQRALQEQTVNEISARFSRSLDVDALLQTAARELGALPEVAEVSVFIGADHDKDNKAMDRKVR